MGYLASKKRVHAFDEAGAPHDSFGHLNHTIASRPAWVGTRLKGLVVYSLKSPLPIGISQFHRNSHQVMLWRCLNASPQRITLDIIGHPSNGMWLRCHFTDSSQLCGPDAAAGHSNSCCGSYCGYCCDGRSSSSSDDSCSACSQPHRDADSNSDDSSHSESNSHTDQRTTDPYGNYGTTHPHSSEKSQGQTYGDSSPPRRLLET